MSPDESQGVKDHIENLPVICQAFVPVGSLWVIVKLLRHAGVLAAAGIRREDFVECHRTAGVLCHSTRYIQLYARELGLHAST